ncbi:MAG: hypothetical protein PVF17_00545 [Ignavibacteria bacterium]|jgi:hypothetical protein
MQEKTLKDLNKERQDQTILNFTIEGIKKHFEQELERVKDEIDYNEKLIRAIEETITKLS